MRDGNELQQRIGRIFSTVLNIELPSADTDLFDTGVLDSLGFVNLLMALEQEFGVTTALDDLEIDNFRSLSRIADFVLLRLGADSPGAPQAMGIPLDATAS